ncbi:MAG: hypothetical protein K0S61_1056 [Anaerocolumna sp.]|jgi:prephenate dehydratase|nr:hypothetical protein [Anaerocolumna sp.]
MNNTGFADKLKGFIEIDLNLSMIGSYLKMDLIQEIRMFVLGPEGTNIYEAAKLWAKEREIESKCSFTLCATPEEAISEAKKVKVENILPVFVLCAVYYKLYELYFFNTDCLFFMDHLYMKLDDMQLAALSYSEKNNYKVFTHPSPAKLVESLENVNIEYSDSNGYAAQECKEEEGALCITTEKARSIYELKKIFDFGSPFMLFTFGTTFDGVKLLENCAV